MVCIYIIRDNDLCPTNVEQRYKGRKAQIYETRTNDLIGMFKNLTQRLHYIGYLFVRH